MKLFGIGKMLTRQTEQEKESANLRTEADRFELATDGGYIKVLKYLLFVLFGYYNARLFIVTVPGWEGYFTAFFALAGEATALYCFNNYTRSTGNHKRALGVFAVLLMAFSVTHATISFFRIGAQAEYSGFIRSYCSHVAFPLLFSLLLLAAVVIPLLHWRAQIAQAQAGAQTEIETGRARLVAESAKLRNESALERERLTHFEEEIKLGNDYVEKLRSFAKMKKSERAALDDIPEPLRSQIAHELGLDLTEAAKPQNPVWQGGHRVDSQPKGNGLGN